MGKIKTSALNQGDATDTNKEQVINASLSNEKKTGYGSKKKLIILLISTSVFIVAILAVVAIVLLNVNGYDYKIVDLTNKPIAEACSMAREHGWKVVEPVGSKYTNRPSTDCDNSQYIVSSYEYDESQHSVKIRWTYRLLEDSEYYGKTISEICALAEKNGLKFKKTSLPEFTFGKGYESAETCDDNRVPDKVYQSDIDGEINIGILVDPAVTNSSDSPASNSSTNSSSTSNDTSSDVCSGKYQENLDIARVAFETAQKTYDTYKSLPNADSSTLSAYQAALDAAKASLDAAQKIYDTYCK